MNEFNEYCKTCFANYLSLFALSAFYILMLTEFDTMLAGVMYFVFCNLMIWIEQKFIEPTNDLFYYN